MERFETPSPRFLPRDKARVAFGAGARKALGPGGDSCCWPRSSPSSHCPVLRWPFTTETSTSSGPQESGPQTLPTHCLPPPDGRGGAGEQIPGLEPALCEPSRCCGWTDGLTDGRARTREEDRPHQARRKRNRHGRSFKSHAGKRVAEEASRGGSQQMGLAQLLLRG